MSVRAPATTVPKAPAWCTTSATSALLTSFLLGRQLTFGHEPPIHLRSTTAVRCPALAMSHAMSLPPPPLPNTKTSTRSACAMTTPGWGFSCWLRATR